MKKINKIFIVHFLCISLFIRLHFLVRIIIIISHFFFSGGKYFFPFISLYIPIHVSSVECKIKRDTVYSLRCCCF